MKTFYPCIIFFAILMKIGIAQDLPLPPPNLPTGWERVDIYNVGTIDIPSSMELQAGEFKDDIDKGRKTSGLQGKILVAQQKGLNSGTHESSQTYVRVILKTTIGNPNDYEKLDFNISSISDYEIDKLNSGFKAQVQNNPMMKLINWYPLKLEKINGMSCIHTSYKRQIGNNPVVFVNEYLCQNYDRTHTLTLSYRLSEKTRWESDINGVLKSFRITNIK